MTFKAEFRVSPYDEMAYVHVDLGWQSPTDRSLQDWRSIRSREHLQEIIDNLQQVAQEWDEWESYDEVRIDGE